MIRIAAALALALALALGLSLTLASGPARAGIECEYMTFQLSDVDNDHHVALCECGRFVAEGDTTRVVAQRLNCTSDGWQITDEMCLDESYTDPDPVRRRIAAAAAMQAYNDSFPYCR